jgi:uncharacterized protein DUF1579
MNLIGDAFGAHTRSLRLEPDWQEQPAKGIQVTDTQPELTLRSVGRGVEAGSVGPPKPGLEHERLEVFIGRWINQGHMVAGEGQPEMSILTSDVYEWMPGKFFVLHTAYGVVGTFGGGGTEIIGYDRDAGHYRSYFFDSAGNATQHRLTYNDDGSWTWQGETTRCNATFSEDGHTQTAHHERTDDGTTWAPSMEVVLTRVD